MKEWYRDFNFRPESLARIAICDKILEGYIEAGYIITVRTLYYQLVSRDIIANNEAEYKKLTGLINDARLAGMIDWDVLTDRGREVIDRPHWEGARPFLDSVIPQYFSDHWDNQGYRVLVVVEKDALAGVLERTCREWDVPLLAAKGYPSASALREMAKNRLIGASDRGQIVVILHLGDHDPSGIDMSRDLEQRLQLFGGADMRMTFERIALNYSQVLEVNPPPNPAKVTDSRADGYIKRFGPVSWELDALSPEYLNRLLIHNIENWVDMPQWEKKSKEIKDIRSSLIKATAKF